MLGSASRWHGKFRVTSIFPRWVVTGEVSWLILSRRKHPRCLGLYWSWLNFSLEHCFRDDSSQASMTRSNEGGLEVWLATQGGGHGGGSGHGDDEKYRPPLYSRWPGSRINRDACDDGKEVTERAKTVENKTQVQRSVVLVDASKRSHLHRE